MELDAALRGVDYQAYVEDGDRPLPQSSSPEVVAHVLAALETTPGMAVLEVGTGSGYSAALLSYLVGDAGRVVSIDVDPVLTARAEGLLRADGRSNVSLATGDARRAMPVAGPYDRMVVWATADAIPGEWVAALHGGGRIVAPVQLAPLEGAAPVACIALHNGEPHTVRFTWGSFIPLTEAPVRDFAALAARRGDVRRDEAAGTAWLSAPWLRAASSDLRRRLEALLTGLRPGPELLQPPERPEDLWWFLVATAPRGLTAAGIPASGATFGHGGPDGLALLRRGPGEGAGRCLIAGNAMRSVLQLQGWIRTWQARGRPGLGQLEGTCRWDEGACAWRVAATVRA